MMGTDLVMTMSLIVVAAAVLLCHRKWKLALLVAIVLTLATWPLIFAFGNRDIQMEQARLQERHQNGERLTQEEWQADGIGDRWALLVMGWVPGAMGAAIGFILVAWIRRRSRRARHREAS